jgi:hypothetical protein
MVERKKPGLRKARAAVRHAIITPIETSSDILRRGPGSSVNRLVFVLYAIATLMLPSSLHA